MTMRKLFLVAALGGAGLLTCPAFAQDDGVHRGCTWVPGVGWVCPPGAKMPGAADTTAYLTGSRAMAAISHKK